MKKNLRYLIIMLAVLVVLGGGAALLLLTQPTEAEEDSSSTSSTTTETVIDREDSEIASIQVDNPSASFQILPLEAASSEEDSQESVQFTIDGYQDYDLDTSEVTGAATTVAAITASKNLGEQEDLEQFGLSGEAATQVTVRYTDGTTDEYTVGNEAGESSGRYLLKDGVVYISSSFSGALLGTPLDFIQTEVYSVDDLVEEVTDEEGNTTENTLSDVLYHVELSGTNLEEPIVIEYDETKISTYLITQPVIAESGSNQFTEMLSALKSLTADSVAAVGRTQENLEEYGLAEPYAQIVFNMNGEDHTLAVSAKNSDGNRYLIADDKDMIYVVSADTVTSWADADLMSLRMSYVWLPNIKDVSAMTLTVEGDMVYRFDVEQVLNEEESTEDSPSYDLVVTNAGGESVEYENYQDLYQAVLSLAVLSADQSDYDQDAPVLEVTYEYFDGSDPDTIVYCTVADQTERYAALLNGQYNGLVRRSEVAKVLTYAEQVNQNQAIQ